MNNRSAITVLMLMCISMALAAASATQPSADVAIRVIGIDEKPVGGVLAVFVPAGRTVDILGRHELDDDANYVRKHTDAEGKVTFALPPGPAVVMVVDDSGYARASAADLRREPVMKLRPWGKISGQFMIGDKAGAGVELMISANDAGAEPGMPGIRVHGEDKDPFSYIKADSEGRFTVNPVPPGDFYIGRHLTWRYADGSAGGIDRDRPVNVKPGQTTVVHLGGDGRTVVGKFVVPAALGDRAQLELGFCRATHKQTPLTPPVPADLANASLKRQQAWYDQFINTDAGRAYQIEKRRVSTMSGQYQPELAKDDSFRIDDVLPGQYTLSAGAWRKGHDGKTYESVGEARGEFNVPADGGTGAVDIGTIEFKAPPHDLSAGDVAPEFTLKSLDGQDVRLSDYRGKYVLLDFWATWCGPCVAELPNLKKLYDATSPGGRLVMISISVDDDPFIPKRYVVEHGDNWLQTFGGHWDESKVSKDYNVGGIPAIYLIGPDGKIIATGLRGDEIGKSVQAALAK